MLMVAAIAMAVVSSFLLDIQGVDCKHATEDDDHLAEFKTNGRVSTKQAVAA